MASQSVTRNLNADLVTSQAACQAELLDGVGTIPNTGAVPGTVVVYGEQAYPVLSTAKDHKTWMAAAQLGEGRIFISAHESFVTKIQADGDSSAVSRLKQNVKKWLTKGTYSGSSDIAVLNQTIQQFSQVEGKKLLVWNGHRDEVLTMEELVQFIMNGGGFIHAMCPWGWLQLNPGKTLEMMPYYKVLELIGVCYTDQYADLPAGGLNSSNHQSSSLSHVCTALNQAMMKPELQSDMAILSCLRPLPDYVIESIIAQHRTKLEGLIACCPDNYVPSRRNPVKKAGRVALSICEILLKHQNKPMPGLDIFPGNFSSPPPKICTDLTFDCTMEDVHPTGYYVAAGDELKVCVMNLEVLLDGWTLQVGAHTDCLDGADSLCRWPNVVQKVPVNKQHLTVRSQFGGLVYLMSPNKCGTLSLRLENVVEAPFFDVTKPDRVVAWQTRRHAPGLWADMCGRFVMFTVPAGSVRELGDPTEVMKAWDEVVAAHHHLRGTDVTQHRRQWIVTDEQPSAGYMHSGYPVVTHLDIADPGHNGVHDFFVFNHTALRTNGAWGLFHEIGHNMQRPLWTFNGTVEVTCNIFTLHAMDVVAKKSPWIHQWLQPRLKDAKSFLENNKTFDQWKSDPGIALFIYAQLVHSFGWGLYKSVFRQYEVMPSGEQPKTEQEKIDTWFSLMSITSGYNLAPLVDFWNIPLSDGARKQMSSLPPFLPDDDVTQLMPAKVDAIATRYEGNVTRQPTEPIPDSFANELQQILTC